jgi:hypothetical protein
MKQLPLLLTMYPPILYRKGELIKRLRLHLEDVEIDEDEADGNWPGNIYEATKEFLIENTELWPEIETDENGHEYQDQENFSIISIDEDGAVIASGGDWQEPLVIYITVDMSGQRIAYKAEFGEFPDKGLYDKDILKIVGR